MKCLHLTFFALAGALALPACVIVQNDDGSGDSANDSANTSGNTGDGTAEGGPGEGNTCNMDDPGGESCEEAADCSVLCQCNSGDVTVGVCINNVCESAADSCGDACGEGGFDGFCREGGGGEGNADSSGGGGECVDAGVQCDVNGDCCGFDVGDSACVNAGDFSVCADLCDFDSDCESDCCADLEQGGGACAPSDFC